MDRQLELQKILENILGSRNVYFQPPSNTKIKYPCIIYDRGSIDSKHADNIKYNSIARYSLMLIGRSPKNELIDEILKLPYCSYDRHYTADTLHHDVFTLFY